MLGQSETSTLLLLLRLPPSLLSRKPPPVKTRRCGGIGVKHGFRSSLPPLRLLLYRLVGSGALSDSWVTAGVVIGVAETLLNMIDRARGIHNTNNCDGNHQ
jgi:hypothetical protein